MFATLINSLLIAVGSFVGVSLGRFIKPRILEVLIPTLGICILIIGIMNAIKVNDTLGMIICIVIGTIIGEIIDIEAKINNLGEFIKGKMGASSAHSRFTEGFLTASVLFCTGSMAIFGSIEAGLNKNYTIILSKAIIDAVTSLSLAAAMGIGVIFSAVLVLLYQGVITLGAGAISSVLSTEVITAMSAVGGAILIASGFNMLEFRHLRVANMLPSIFLPIAYVPLTGLFIG